jgi:hypothetical protein
MSPDPCAALFEASHPFGFFDYFRVPYRLVPTDPVPDYVGSLRAGNGRTLYWVRADPDHRPPRSRYRSARFRLAGRTLAGHLYAADPPRTLPGAGRRWQVRDPVSDVRGRPVSAVWSDAEGNVFLPFDPAEVMQVLWSERYTTLGRAGILWRLR